MRWRKYAGLVSVVVCLVCAVPLACDSFDEGATNAPSDDAGGDASTGDSAGEKDGGAGCTPGATLASSKLAPKLFDPQTGSSAYSCIVDGGVELGNGLAADPVDGGEQVKGCAGIDLGALESLSELTVLVTSKATSPCGGDCVDCIAASSARLFLLYSADDTTWNFGPFMTTPALGNGASTVAFDLSNVPATRYLALCRWNQGGAIVRVQDARAICR